MNDRKYDQYPDTAKCPECGRMMDLVQDRIGYVYACDGHDCWSHFAADELFPKGPPK